MSSSHYCADKASVCRLSAFTLALLSLGSTAWAQTTNNAVTQTRTLTPIVVQGQDAQSPLGPVDGYIATRSISATKTDTPLIETPQSVTVVTQEQIEDTGAQSLQDALNYAAGVRTEAYGVDSRSDNFRIRGASPSIYLDGLRTNYNYYTSTTRTEPYTLERVEVLRGPSSMLYGQGSTAGVINMVSKRPQEEAHHEIGISYGSHNRRQIQADLTGAIDEDGKWLYRLVALKRKSNTQVDYVRDDRWVLAPSLTWRPSASTSLTLLALLQEDKSGSTSQFFPWEGVATYNPNGQLPTNRFIGDPDWDRYNSKRRAIGWEFEHKFNDNWTVRQNTRFSKNEVDYRSLYGDSFTLPGGWAGDPINKRMLGRIAYGSIKNVFMASADQHLEGKFDTGALKHHVLLGFDATYGREEERSAYDAPNYNGGTVPLIDAYNPVYPAYTPPSFSELPTIRQRDIGFYVQDQMRYQNWIFVAGLRYDRSTNAPDGGQDQTSTAWTNRFGIMYAFENGVSPYVSYSESFTPVLGRTSAGSPYVPLRGKQIEAGLKYESFDGNILVNTAVYNLKEENSLVSDPANPTQNIQAGKTTNRGFEIEVKAKVTRKLNVLANYNYTDVDEQLEALPRHQAALWGKYQITGEEQNGLSAGAGVRWFGAFTDGNAPRTPSVTLVDAMIAYETPDWRLALNANNIFDKVYVSTCLSRGDCWYGARRSIVASATYKF